MAAAIAVITGRILGFLLVMIWVNAQPAIMGTRGETISTTVEIWTGEKIAWEALHPDLPKRPQSSFN